MKFTVMSSGSNGKPFKQSWRVHWRDLIRLIQAIKTKYERFGKFDALAGIPHEAAPRIFLRNEMLGGSSEEAFVMQRPRHAVLSLFDSAMAHAKRWK